MSLVYKRKYRRHLRKRTRLTLNLASGLIIFGILLSIFLTLNNLSQNSGPELIYQPVVVSSGDTLWKLAQNSGLKQDTRTIIVMIKKYNALPNGVIYPGQVIYIPTQTSYVAINKS